MVTYSYLSETGERHNNEDCVRIVKKDRENWLFLLADGLGGHGGGEIASALVVREAGNYYEQSTDSCPDLGMCFEYAQEKLLLKQREEERTRDLKSTLVLLELGKEQVRWGHVGDSRLYYFKDKKLAERTLDHSVSQILALSGEIREEDIRKHPDRNRLLRAMGSEWETSSYQLSDQYVCQGDEAFLLCSDGFWEYIDEGQMEACLCSSENPGQWLGKMRDIVLRNGQGQSMDNYSAITIMLFGR